MPRKIRIDMTGLRYGRLVGIAFSHAQDGHAHWLFACDCGVEAVIKGTSVRLGRTASCGCLHSEISAERLTTHGRRAARRHDPTYRAWQEINSSCTDANAPRFRVHGAKGIAVCPRWRTDFTAFLADMGERPAGTKLDRIDPAADFGPGNCRWSELVRRARRATEGRSGLVRESQTLSGASLPRPLGSETPKYSSSQP